MDAYKYLNSLNIFESVDFDYIMKADGEVQSVDISGNTYADELQYLDSQGIKAGWNYLAENDKNPGGSNDVIIAIIDTGVDYNHLDLRDNIWVNTAEIPNNGIDDDNNGYIDDINGWNCVGDNNNPMDDNGHGTHVAGIAAASNNEIGTIGVAYNCKIMCLKAGNSSGYFNSSDIAEAVEYAYMNGASVINMSFGGTSISRFTEDALENAYNQCVLVAAAGNESLCNNLKCEQHSPKVGVSYPASLPYVIGVMSCNIECSQKSVFTNFDHYPNGNIEYEIYACGESIKSTWPNNKYASLSGTSMATPVVAGAAAVMRSIYLDREVYSTKYIQSQLINVSKKTLNSHNVLNLYDSLTSVPSPYVKLYDFYIFDNVEFSDKNNGDGAIDAGETIHLAVEFINRGGVASNVEVSLDTIRNNDPSLTDPYFNIINGSISLSDIGTYSVRDGNKIYNNGLVVDVEKCFIINISDDCPHDYLSNLNISMSCNNGLNEDDNSCYLSKSSIQLSVSSGEKLPSMFTEDTTLTANKKYIVNRDVFIPEGITVNVEPGVEIQFYENNFSYYESIYNSPTIIVGGTLNFNGTEDNMINIYPSELFSDYCCHITKANFKYTNVINLSGPTIDSYFVTSGDFSADHCTFTQNNNRNWQMFIYNGDTYSIGQQDLGFNSLSNSYLSVSCVAQLTHVNIGDAYNNKIEFIAGYNIVNYRDELYITNGENNLIITDKLEEASKVGAIYIDNSKNNVFMPKKYSRSIKDYFTICINDPSNTLLGGYDLFYDTLIDGFYTANGNGTPLFDINDKTDVDLELLWPFIKDVKLFISEEKVTKVGFDEFTVQIEFNRPVTSTTSSNVLFGSCEPYSDYLIKGEFISETIWEGTYKLKSFIENGEQFFTIKNFVATTDRFKDLISRGYYSFVIDTTEAMSMNIQANPTDEGIELNWAQDDYETLMGYNIYRSEEKDGNFVKINPYILSPDELSFLDDNAEPGKTYWYTFTVVLSDFTESSPAGKVVTTARDTLAPNLYHTPVNQGYLNNNLVISCIATDNIAITKVMLYYRIKGTTEWKSLQMVKQNDKYNATIFGSELSLEGMEYYIVAQDTQNIIYKGSQELPYNVIIKDSSSIIKLGDVDGDGIINTKDALMIIRAINDELILTDDQFKRADLNKDGILSSVEALRILQYINGNINSLEMN